MLFRLHCEVLVRVWYYCVIWLIIQISVLVSQLRYKQHMCSVSVCIIKTLYCINGTECVCVNTMYILIHLKALKPA